MGTPTDTFGLAAESPGKVHGDADPEGVDLSDFETVRGRLEPYGPERLALDRIEAEVERLRARNGRLRKAVNWLRGTLHHGDDQVHNGTIDECEAWECQRTRAILEGGGE